MARKARLKVELFPEEVQFDSDYRCFISSGARETLRIDLPKLHSQVLVVSGEKRKVRLRAYQGRQGDPKDVIRLNPFIRSRLQVRKGEFVEVRLACCVERCCYWLTFEHRSELIAGIVAGLVTESVIQFVKLIQPLLISGR